MVAETAEVARADVGAEEFLSVIGVVVLQHEVGMEDAGATLLVIKAFPIVHHGGGDDDLVEDLPIGLVLQGAFEAQAVVFPEQVDEAAFFHLGGMAGAQHVVDAGVGGTVVQVAHHDDLGMVAFWGGRHDGIDFAAQNRCRARARAYGLQLAAVTARPVVDEDVEGITRLREITGQARNDAVR